MGKKIQAAAYNGARTVHSRNELTVYWKKKSRQYLDEFWQFRPQYETAASRCRRFKKCRVSDSLAIYTVVYWQRNNKCQKSERWPVL